MKIGRSWRAGGLIAVALCLVFLTTGTVMGSDKEHEKAAPKAKAATEHEFPEFFVTPPPFSEGIFPCSQCHAGMEPNKERRELYFHTEVQEAFDHAAEQRWCLDCHNPNDRDKLRLVSEKLVSFEESYYLCGQCHGTIFRDWKAGIHGKRTGEWDGKKTYRLCVNCHNPHSPKFRPLHPLPAPNRPDEYKYRKVMAPEEFPTNPIGDLK